MVEHRHRYSGIPAVALLLFVTACAGLPNGAGIQETRLSVGEAEEIFAAGFSNITDKYIDDISVETLALEGLRGLSTLDPGISVKQNGDTLQMRYRRGIVDHVTMPATDDSIAWASVVAHMTADAQTFSRELAAADPEALYEAIFDGAIGALDAFSRYAGKAEANDNRARRDGFGGIGVSFSLEGGRALVTDVMPLTPAAQAGVLVNDEMVSIQGRTVHGLNIDAINDLLRGPVGSDVDLVIARNDLNALTLNMKRSHIVPRTVESDTKNGILYIKISSFNQGTASSVVDSLHDALDPDSATRQEIKGIVLDLRGNPGGLLKQAIEVADTFLVHGDILNTRGRNPDSVQHYEASGQDLAFGLPLAVLIDGKSASAAEIVAAALQDRERAVVIGTASYGKGTVQTVVRLPNSGEITLTWSRFMAPSGYTLHGLGVFPVICTSGPGVSIDKILLETLEKHDKTVGIIDKWRNTTYKDKDTFTSLRNQCPPEQHNDEGDLEIARAVIKDGPLYFRELDLTPATARVAD